MDEHEDDLAMRADRVMAARGFERAVELYAESMTRFRLTGPAMINKLLGQDVRFRTVCFTLYLHHDVLDGKPDAGATYSRLLELISGTIGGSQRVVTTTLSLMLAMDFVRVEASPHDRRVKFYRPTERMFAVVRTWLANVFACLDLIEPDAGRAAQLAAGDAILQRFVLGVGRDFRGGETLTGRAPEFACFFDREGGWPLLALAIRAAYGGPDLPSRGEIARMFGLSKTQIASVVAEAIERGFLAAEGRDLLRPTPLLLERYRRWIAICLAFFHRATALPEVAAEGEWARTSA